MVDMSVQESFYLFFDDYVFVSVVRLHNLQFSFCKVDTVSLESKISLILFQLESPQWKLLIYLQS